MPDKKGADSTLSRWLKRNEAKGETRGFKPMGLNSAPLSYGQQRLYMLQSIYPENPFYHYSDLHKFYGPVKPESLLDALDIIVSEHSALQTVFRIIDDKPLQIIDSSLEMERVVRDFSADQASIDAFLRTEARRPFNLERGPLIRAAVAVIDADSFYLLITCHHLITDQWSMDVLRRQLALLFRSNGNSRGLNFSEARYTDFSAWQQQQDINTSYLDYWRTQLAGAPEFLNLPADAPRPARPSYRGGIMTREIDSELSTGIRELARVNEVTTFTALLAAFYSLLFRYSSDDDICIGTPIADRSLTLTEKTIGFFNNTIVLRQKNIAEKRFNELLGDVQKMVLEAFDHRDLPFELLVRELKPERSLGTHPLFQVMFLYHREESPPDFGEGIHVSNEPFDLGVSKFDITLYCKESQSNIELKLEYSDDLFDPGTIEVMLGHFETLLRVVTKTPSTRLSELSLIDATERNKLLHSFGTTPGTKPKDTLVHNAIRKVADRLMDKPAIWQDGQFVSYKDLIEKANAISHAIENFGIGPGSRVGLCVDRSVDMVAGMLGILQTGSAYIPLDPSYPVNRIAFMIEDSHCDLVLTSAKISKTLAHPFNSCVYFDDIDEAPDWKARQEVGPDSQAYIIYTSGSSGKPKGVPVTHRQLIASTHARFNYYSEHPGNFLLMSSYSFDSSVAGIYWTLFGGGCLVLPPDRIEQDIERLSTLMAECDITHTLMLPSLYSAILEFARDDAFKTLKVVAVAGEKCGPALRKRHFGRIPQVELHNEYGPTEATVWSTVHRLSPSDKDRPVPIGRPIPGAINLIVDTDGKQVPIGVAGELVLGGPGITDGYLNNPKLTDERFVTLSFNNTSERIYRTGDRARFKHNGDIQFLGRLDNQVKIRGYRIEPDEVAQTINQIPGIRDSAVVAYQEDNNSELVAYCVAEDKDLVSLKRELAPLLPDYMVPSQFVLLGEIPRLPNGKVNKNALDRPEKTPTTGSQSRLPKTPVEAALLKIWKDVLKIDDISVDDNFFEIGGDSILSIQIVARARREGLVIAPDSIFEHQTIAEIALFTKKVNSFEETPDNNRLPPILLPIQCWFFENFKNAPHYWNQILRLHLKDDVGVDELHEAIETITLKQAALRLQFVRKDDQWSPVVRDEIGENVFVQTSETDIDGHLRSLQRATQLDSTPLFRCIYHSDKQAAYLIAHHLVIDAVSWRIIVSALDDLLSNRELTPPSTSFAAWGRYLSQEHKVTKEDVRYWRAQCDATTASNKESPTEAETEQFTSIVDKELTKALKEIAPRIYHMRVEEVLLAALLKAMQKTAGKDRWTVEMESHGREEQGTMDLSSTVGWFTSLFPQVFDLPEELDDLLRTVKDQIRQIPRGGIDFGVMKYLSREDGQYVDLNYTPDVLFNYLGEMSLSVTDDSRIIGSAFVNDLARTPESEFLPPIAFNIYLDGEVIHVVVSYSTLEYDHDSVVELSELFQESLGNIISHGDLAETDAYTPSDFPESGLSQDALDNLFDQLSKD